LRPERTPAAGECRVSGKGCAAGQSSAKAASRAFSMAA
jgi:hypothetical protein